MHYAKLLNCPTKMRAIKPAWHFWRFSAFLLCAIWLTLNIDYLVDWASILKRFEAIKRLLCWGGNRVRDFWYFIKRLVCNYVTRGMGKRIKYFELKILSLIKFIKILWHGSLDNILDREVPVSNFFFLLLTITSTRCISYHTADFSNFPNQYLPSDISMKLSFS